jgi:hypothetical protein
LIELAMRIIWQHILKVGPMFRLRSRTWMVLEFRHRRHFLIWRTLNITSEQRRWSSNRQFATIIRDRDSELSVVFDDFWSFWKSSNSIRSHCPIIWYSSTLQLAMKKFNKPLQFEMLIHPIWINLRFNQQCFIQQTLSIYRSKS